VLDGTVYLCRCICMLVYLSSNITQAKNSPWWKERFKWRHVMLERGRRGRRGIEMSRERLPRVLGEVIISSDGEFEQDCGLLRNSWMDEITLSAEGRF
jgi:hypothetical protein